MYSNEESSLVIDTTKFHMWIFFFCSLKNFQLWKVFPDYVMQEITMTLSFFFQFFLKTLRFSGGSLILQAFTSGHPKNRISSNLLTMKLFFSTTPIRKIIIKWEPEKKINIRLRIIKVTTTQTQIANMRSFYTTFRVWNQTKTSHSQVTWIALFWSVKTKVYPFLSFFLKTTKPLSKKQILQENEKKCIQKILLFWQRGKLLNIRKLLVVLIQNVIFIFENVPCWNFKNHTENKKTWITRTMTIRAWSEKAKQLRAWKKTFLPSTDCYALYFPFLVHWVHQSPLFMLYAPCYLISKLTYFSHILCTIESMNDPLNLCSQTSGIRCWTKSFKARWILNWVLKEAADFEFFCSKKIAFEQQSAFKIFCFN